MIAARSGSRGRKGRSPCTSAVHFASAAAPPRVTAAVTSRVARTVTSIDACGGCLRRQEVPNARNGQVREHGFSTRIRPCLMPRSAGSRGQVSANSRGISPAKFRPSSGPIAKSPPRKLRALAGRPRGRIARPHRLQARASESIQSKNDDFDQLTIALDDCRSLPAPRRWCRPAGSLARLGRAQRDGPTRLLLGTLRLVDHLRHRCHARDSVLRVSILRITYLQNILGNRLQFWSKRGLRED